MVGTHTSMGISGNEMSVCHGMPPFRFHCFLPERTIGELPSPNPLQVAQSATVLLRASGGPDLIFATILQAERGRGEEGGKEGRKAALQWMRTGAGGRTQGRADGGWADSLAALSLSPLTSHDDAVSLRLPASFLPSFLRFLSRGRLARPESVDDDDDDEHTS